MERRIKELEAQVLTQRQVQLDLERELKRFQGLYELAIAMTRDQSMDDTLQLVVDQCCRLLQTDVSYITLQDESRGGFFKHTSTGIRTKAFREMRLPTGMGLAGKVAEDGSGYMVEDYLEEISLDGDLRAVIDAEGIVSGMAAPVQMASKRLGLLYVFNRRRTAFSQSDLETLALIGNLAAVEISRKDAERSLRESEERFRFMAGTTGDVIYRLRYDTMSYDYVSPGIRKLTGYTTQEINAIGFSKLVTRIDLPGRENVLPQELVRERQDGKVGEYRADYLITTCSGATKWLRDHSFPWCDAAGRTVGSVGILSDVSEYKRAEALLQQRTEELAASEEKLRTLVENVPLVVYRLSPTGEILFVNHFVEDLFGYTPLEITNNPGLWSEALYDKDRTYVEAQREKVYRGGEELITEYRVKHKQGHLVDVIDHAIPLRTPEGAISVVNGIIMDISWKVRLHEQLVRDEGLKTISEVSARLAHEIRNPLVSAGGFARRLLSSMSPGDPNRTKVEIIIKEVARLEAILRMILNYLQPLELDLLPLNVNTVVENALRSLGEELQRWGVELEVDFQKGLPAFPGDPKLLEQVLETLLSNALQQMPEGSRLLVRTSLGAGMLELLLRYPAPRLSADDAEHFFYPFTASPAAFEAIDLPMCKIIIDKHGGAIKVEVEYPKQLVIRVFLPLERDRAKKVILPDK